MHGLPIHTCCRTLLQCLRYYCLPQAGLLLTNLHLLTQTVASFTNLFCCLTPLSIFFVNLNLIVTHVAVSWWGSIYIYFFFCCTLMHKCKILPHACVLFAHSRFLLHADARLCMFCKFTFVCKHYARLLAIIICSQTMHRALNFLLVAARCCGICQFILVAASWLIVIHTF